MRRRHARWTTICAKSELKLAAIQVHLFIKIKGCQTINSFSARNVWQLNEEEKLRWGLTPTGSQDGHQEFLRNISEGIIKRGNLLVDATIDLRKDAVSKISATLITVTTNVAAHN